MLLEKLDNPACSTDVIVGFPGETDAEFQETLDVCRRAGFMKIHVFPFSARNGTPAADLPDQVPPDVKKERGRQLSALADELARQYYESLVGREIGVLIEREISDRPGWVSGTACRYAPVEMRGDVASVGEIIDATGIAATDRGIQVALS